MYAIGALTAIVCGSCTQCGRAIEFCICDWLGGKR